MEPSFTRYIWTHTSRQQIWILSVVMFSMIPYYLAFDLPKMIINGPIQGEGFQTAESTQTYLADYLFAGFELNRTQALMVLSLGFLALVIINGIFKYYINTFKGLLGERLLRRIRFDLVDRILRFQPGEFKRIKGGEISSMIKDEVEPLGGFTAEAFVQPVLLGGQALTALAFIFVQHFWLGLVALFMASVQMLVIPRLRRRLLVLGRERQIKSRQLAGRVVEIVEGIDTIHTYDTSNYERADVSSRLGVLFKIRYEIYLRKFKIKFLNNFLAQLTPFLFYLVGGFLAITGRLDVGQLVAVIAAYKELPGPLKELIDWDLAKQDVQVKYEQIIEQFDADEMLPASVQAVDTLGEQTLDKPLSAINLTIEDEGGAVALDNVSVTVEAGQSIALVGDAYSGANVLAEALGGIVRPARGRITAGTQNLAALPESITGRRMTYASADTYFFSGSLEDNLLYGLKHSPLEEVHYADQEAVRRKWERQEANRTGNPFFDLKSNWIDFVSVNGPDGSRGLLESLKQVLAVTHLYDDVFDFALHTIIRAHEHGDLSRQIVTLRKRVREELESRGLTDLIIPFEMESYNDQAQLLDNILFGILTNTRGNGRTVEGTEYLRSTMAETGLDELLYNMGMKIAETVRDLFDNLPPDHPFFDRLDFMDPSEIPHYRALYQRTKSFDFQSINEEDRYAWIELSFRYTESRYRFGLLDDKVISKVIETRKMLLENAPERLRVLIDVYDPEQFQISANLIDNIVFGKVDHRFKDAERQVRSIIEHLLDRQPALFDRIFAVGLTFNVGGGGRRLTAAQRQKFNFARALLRRSDYYIFNRPITGVDQKQQEQILRNTLYFLSKQGENPGIVWVLASQVNARYFDRCIAFDDKAIVDDRLLETFEFVPDSLVVDKLDGPALGRMVE
ncbi:ABC transporter transmembrane domain-containing protein [Granulosicoccus antarcticus]|uniref:Lactococcin-G-processing and transport ATP-binding protein LagD n=1 Tax=Granulosicoccus antarcticus IMCC3135 TaxID=1192854 RepID=A0A2Z2NXG7_9GAMM|nr:ABC transporter transmembrane domain-containing protein [Granulosicoccus antarcticus]ASJ75953.1 Lactococcin-G-processing and transport ATP-binding protein LagD [Granulosicoccus antarcticus IMCC3135]